MYIYGVESLLSKTISRLCDDLHTYPTPNKDIIRNLPLPIKDLILKRLTRSKYFWHHLDPKEALPLILHQNTPKVDLTFVKVDDELLQLLEPCTYLKELRLTGDERNSPTTEGLCKLFKSKKRLQYLHLPNCVGVTDDVVKAIVENCPYLMRLALNGCKSVTDATLHALSSMNHLTCLDVSATQVSDQGMEGLSKGSSKDKIKELRIAHCPNITFQTLTTVAENCPNVEVFEFHNCCQSKDGWELSVFENTKMKHLKQFTFTV